MALFDYSCINPACTNTMRDVEQRVGAEPLRLTCDVCGAMLTRAIGPTAFALRGTGWAKDGYSKPKGDK